MEAPPASQGTVFSLEGHTEYFVGTNAWWLGHLPSDADVEQSFMEIASTDLKVVRVWGFGNANSPADQDIYYQLLDNTTTTITINEGENGIPRLDSVIRLAEQYNVKLVLPLLNNWDDLGGIATYCNYFGCNATTFYTNTGAQTAYQNYIRYIVNRYKSSPAIFAWQLCNEPRCHGCDPSIITNWATTTSSLIKSLDPAHMVSLGDEGWFCSGGDGSYAYSCDEGVDFEANMAIPTLDYAGFHMYPDQWGYEYSWGNQWIEEHAAMAGKYGKPIVFEEYGAADDLANRTEVMREWQMTITQSEIAYDSWWQFATNFTDGTDPYDKYAIYYGTEEYQGLVVQHVKEMEAKNLPKK